jgi:hypothetical protein
LDPGLPADARNVAVRVAVAPGATFVAGVEDVRALLPKIPANGATLFAVMSPLLVTEIVMI